MLQKSLGAGLLVLIELGATWPRALVEGSVHEAKRVLVELEGEGPLAFAERVRAVAGSLFARGVALELAVISCNQRGDQAAMAARRSIVRSFSGRRGMPRVVFATPPGAREPFRHALGALVEELGRAARQRGSVSVATREAPSDAIARVA